MHSRWLLLDGLGSLQSVRIAMHNAGFVSDWLIVYLFFGLCGLMAGTLVRIARALEKFCILLAEVVESLTESSEPQEAKFVLDPSCPNRLKPRF